MVFFPLPLVSEQRGGIAPDDLLANERGRVYEAKDRLFSTDDENASSSAAAPHGDESHTPELSNKGTR